MSGKSATRAALALSFTALLGLIVASATMPQITTSLLAAPVAQPTVDPRAPVRRLIDLHHQPASDQIRAASPLPADEGRVLLLVRPQETDADIDNVLQDHDVIRQTAVAPNGTLFGFFPGAWGRPQGYQFILDAAARRGYLAIGLEYPDATDDPERSSPSQVCQPDLDVECYTRM